MNDESRTRRLFDGTSWLGCVAILNSDFEEFASLQGSVGRLTIDDRDCVR